MASTAKVKKCPACGGTDHQRRSSPKCPYHIARVRKREAEIPEGYREDTYIVKRGLCGALCPLLEEETRTKLLSEIRRDVRDLSRMFIELGIYANFYYNCKYDLVDFPNKPDFLALLKDLKNNNRKERRDPILTTYMGLRSQWNLEIYDGKLRSHLLEELAKKYETGVKNNFKNLITFRRLKRFFNESRVYRQYCKDIQERKIHQDCFQAFYKQNYIGIDSKIKSLVQQVNCKTPWWDRVKIMIEIQHSMKKSFRLFPQPTHGLKHITYSSACWFELLRRVDRTNIPGDWPKIRDPKRELWYPYLENMKNFAGSLQTDGRSVSLLMNRLVKETVPKTKEDDEEEKVVEYQPSWWYESKPLRKKYQRIVAVDPGSRYPLVTCEKDGRNRDLFKGITKKYVTRNTLEWKRERVRIKMTSDSEGEEAEDREKINQRLDFELSSKNKEFRDYTNFRLKWLNRRQQPYDENPKLTRMRLHKYIRQTKLNEQISKEVFDAGGGKNVLVLYGAGAKFMNTKSFSGRKFKHDSLLKTLSQKKNIDLEVVDEAFTSKACSTCNERERRMVMISINHGLRWGVCPNCHSGFDRDKNGAKNILLRHTLCRPSGGQDSGSRRSIESVDSSRSHRIPLQELHVRSNLV